ncbi:hypothetical protein HPB48_003299 [Haemaphysalis longicornis]|uniref:Uncharacterized protein n=1 Tax=Haemaphysalis longicornis TaxID=44386 RepID=A0A9J6GYB4_HAELO|nr:hypothetical protein HPB48_003299 [Haemaphysalis longicornis]
MNPHYMEKLASIPNETDTVILLHYVGYRIAVHSSPLPKVASPLLRLSYDGNLEFVSDRLQAKRISSLLLKHYDHSMLSIEPQLKSAMTDRLLSSSSWLERSAICIGVDKLKNMRLVFLGSTDDINTVANYYNFNARHLDPANLVESFREIQAGTMKV